MSSNKKSWKDLTPVEQRAIVIGGTAEVLLTAVALRDLTRRPATEVRGPKWAWVLAFVVQPFGPLAYLATGRRRGD